MHIGPLKWIDLFAFINHWVYKRGKQEKISWLYRLVAKYHVPNRMPDGMW